MPELDARPSDDEVVLHELRVILVEDLRVPCAPEQIDRDVMLFGSGLALDSVDAVDLAVAIDRRLRVRVGEGPAAREHMRSVAALVEHVVGLRAEAQAATEADVTVEPDPVFAAETSVAFEGDGFPSEPSRAPLPPSGRTVPPGYRALRSAVALCPERDVRRFALRGPAAFDVVDRLSTRDVFVRPDGVLPTLLLDDEGRAWASAMLCARGDDFIVLATGPPRAELAHRLHQAVKDGDEVVIEDLEDSHALVGVHGPFAWELMERLVGPEVVGIPYLSSFALFEADGRCFRAGETGEYGYDLLFPRERAAGLVEHLETLGAPLGLARAGEDALRLAGIESGFFQAGISALREYSPIVLQLAWCLAMDRDVPGMGAARAALRDDRRRVRWFVMNEDVDVERGVPVLREGVELGTVAHAEHGVGLAVLDGAVDAGPCQVGGHPARICTVPLTPSLSLRVDPQRHRYGARHEDGLVDG